MATPNYSVNYDDKRFAEVEADKKAAINEVDKTYGNMISQSDKFYQKQIDAANAWADKQTQLQNQQTDFAIEKIEQQKDQAKKDYLKEQSGAYVDWQKQSNQYGANAEAMASQGMLGTGYSESSQVSMYNTYQNRVATAREAYSRAVLNYDNAIKDARLQNSSALAEIAFKALQQELEMSLAGFQYKNQLLIEQADKKMDVDNNYYARYQDVVNQINTENAMAEEVRQYNQNYALQEKEYEEGVRQFNAELALQKARLAEEQRQFDVTQANKGSSGGGGGSGGSGGTRSSGTKGNSNSGKKVNFKPASVDQENNEKKYTYSDVAATAAQLRKKGASKAEILQYLNTTVNSKNYKATSSVKQDLFELTSGYVGHSGR